jgi:metal-responsive CopG/Arc/MetJ family transcriptional regulator
LIMPTDKPRLILTLDKELLILIDDYRYANRIPNRSEAIRRLIKEALDDFKWRAEAHNLWGTGLTKEETIQSYEPSRRKVKRESKST